MSGTSSGKESSWVSRTSKFSVSLVSSLIRCPSSLKKDRFSLHEFTFLLHWLRLNRRFIRSMRAISWNKTFEMKHFKEIHRISEQYFQLTDSFCFFSLDISWLWVSMILACSSIIFKWYELRFDLAMFMLKASCSPVSSTLVAYKWSKAGNGRVPIVILSLEECPAMLLDSAIDFSNGYNSFTELTGYFSMLFSLWPLHTILDSDIVHNYSYWSLMFLEDLTPKNIKLM